MDEEPPRININIEVIVKRNGRVLKTKELDIIQREIESIHKKLSDTDVDAGEE